MLLVVTAETDVACHGGICHSQTLPSGVESHERRVVLNQRMIVNANTTKHSPICAQTLTSRSLKTMLEVREHYIKQVTKL